MKERRKIESTIIAHGFALQESSEEAIRARRIEENETLYVMFKPDISNAKVELAMETIGIARKAMPKNREKLYSKCEKYFEWFHFLSERTYFETDWLHIEVVLCFISCCASMHFIRTTCLENGIMDDASPGICDSIWWSAFGFVVFANLFQYIKISLEYKKDLTNRIKAIIALAEKISQC